MTATGIQGERIAALSYELDNAGALWTSGRAQLLQMRPDSAGVVLALLSAGAEKLLKLTLGLHALDTVGEWPTVQVMRTHWGHRIAELDSQVLALLRSRTRGVGRAAVHRGGAGPRTASDPMRTELFGTLQAYAWAGRFAHLDTLAGSGSDVPSPRQRWDALKTSLVAQHPSLLTRLGDPTADLAACLAEVAGLLDVALQWWQYALYRCWQHGLAGADARRWSAQLSIAEPPGLVIGGG